MKIRKVTLNNRKKEFVVENRAGKVLSFPFSKADPTPTTTNRVVSVEVDKEPGNEAFTYVLSSGDEGTVHIDSVLEYNEDPDYLAELLIYRLSVEARNCMEDSDLSRRQIAARLNTSVPQLYRLLDPGNSRKSINQLVSLLHVLDCDVDFVVKRKATA
jgi:predicted XRE-type DNA-binding protein